MLVPVAIPLCCRGVNALAQSSIEAVHPPLFSYVIVKC